MRRFSSSLFAFLILASAAGVGFAAETFTATAEFESDRTLGTSRVAFTLVVDRTTSIEEARRLVGLLAQGGQGLLRSALQGKGDGRIQLGALEMPVSLVVVAETEDGHVYSVLTDRPLRRGAGLENEDPGAPFGVLRFEVDRGGLGEGLFHAATALALDETRAVVVTDPKEPGRLLEIRRQN